MAHDSFMDLLKGKDPNKSNKEFKSELPLPDGVRGHILSAAIFKLQQLGGSGQNKDDNGIQVKMPDGEIKR